MCLNAHAQMHWDSVSSRLDGEVKTMFSDSTRLVIGGDFMHIGTIPNQGVAIWNGIYLDSIGNFLCNPVYCLHKKNNLIFANHCSHVFKYDSAWSELDTGMVGIPLCYADTDSILYVGGSFHTVNGMTSTGLATWDGHHWANFQMPFSGSVCGIKFFQNKLYVAGSLFDSLGNKVYVANYDGSIWTNISNGILGFSSWVSSMAICNNKLYVAGYFSQALGSAGNSIIMWDGNTWNPLGQGIENSTPLFPQVNTLYVHDSILYVGGIFDHAGGLPASNIAVWDGRKWCAFGNHFNNAILSISVWQNNLYVGGRFTMIDSNDVLYLAKWNGVYDSCINVLSIEDPFSNRIRIFPNPTYQSLSVTNTSGPIQEVCIYSLLGIKLYSRAPQTQNIEISVQDFVSGVYFIHISTKKGVIVRKFLKL